MTDEEIKRYAARLDDTNLCDRIETADGFIDEHGIDSYVGALAADYRVALEALTAARRERDKALANQRDTNNRLCIVEMALAAHRARTGQETNARIEAMRRRTEEALAQVAEAFEERDASYEARASAERSAAEAWAKYRADKAEMRAEAEQRGRAAERRRMRAAVEQMMADAVHEAADARQQCVDHGETRIRLDDRARASGRIDTCEAVLEMLDGRHVGAAGKGET